MTRRVVMVPDRLYEQLIRLVEDAKAIIDTYAGDAPVGRVSRWLSEADEVLS